MFLSAVFPFSRDFDQVFKKWLLNSQKMSYSFRQRD